ncbi:MAG: hypothetical protein SFW63_01885 [Alphaproteobacteria bacterium]|nr:hypothetical protein [Alphaproteobacteria bacterium]
MHSSAQLSPIPLSTASTIRDYVSLMKPGVMSLVVFTGMASLLLTKPVLAGEDCPVYNKGLLESVQTSDAIVKIASENRREDHRIDSYSVGQVLQGDIANSQHIKVRFPIQDVNVASNLIRETGLRYDTVVYSQGQYESDTFFLLRKMDNDYCLVASINVFKSLSIIEPHEVIKRYLAFKDSPPAKQALGIFELLFESIHADDGAANNYFPIPTLLHDWEQVKENIDQADAQKLVKKSFDSLMKSPKGTATGVAIPFMSDDQKRTLVSLLLQDYDAYMEEKKRFCHKEKSSANDAGNKHDGHAQGMTVEVAEWMRKCMPPLTHLSIAYVMGMGEKESQVYLNDPDPVIQKAREFVKSGPMEPYNK